MGFRFRKSIRIGKFFRINLSKSGTGASTTIPGTGLSWGVSPSRRRAQDPAAEQGFVMGCLSKIALAILLFFLLLFGLAYLASLGKDNLSPSPPTPVSTYSAPLPRDFSPGPDESVAVVLVADSVPLVERTTRYFRGGRFVNVVETSYWENQYRFVKARHKNKAERAADVEAFREVEMQRSEAARHAKEASDLAEAARRKGGQAKRQAGKDAEVARKQALEAKRRDGKATTILNMGRGLQDQGNRATALDHYRRVVDEFPDTPAAKEAATRIKAVEGK